MSNVIGPNYVEGHGSWVFLKVMAKSVIDLMSDGSCLSFLILVRSSLFLWSNVCVTFC